MCSSDLARGYLATSTRAGAPGVVVIQEWWGLQDQIKGICDRLAAAGYHALAPDLYNGVAVPYHDPEAANAQMTSLNFIDATDNAVRGAVQYFKKQGLKAGLTGFCMGGAVTIIGLQDFLADRVGSWVTVIIGGIFVVCVMVFRRGIVGELLAWRKRRLSPARQSPPA